MKAAQTDSDKFEEYYQVWREVHNDLKKVKLESSLSSPHVLELFLSKLPQSSREQYIFLKNRPTMDGKPLIDVINEFMTTERIRQGDLKRLEILGSGKRGQSETRAPAVKCGKVWEDRSPGSKLLDQAEEWFYIQSQPPTRWFIPC